MQGGAHGRHINGQQVNKKSTICLGIKVKSTLTHQLILYNDYFHKLKDDKCWERYKDREALI